jgi:NCAIR mutase (PurE)-related protein
MTKFDKVKELVQIVKQIDELKQKEQELRQELLSLLNRNECVNIDGYTVEKKIIKETITDPSELVKNGFDINKVTVTITKIDPVLVRTVGEKENKMYYKEVDRIVVVRNKNNLNNLVSK